MAQAESVSWMRWGLDKEGESWRKRETVLKREEKKMKDEGRHGGWMAEKEREG